MTREEWTALGLTPVYYDLYLKGYTKDPYILHNPYDREFTLMQRPPDKTPPYWLGSFPTQEEAEHVLTILRIIQ